MYHGKYLVLYHINTLKSSDNKIKYFRGIQYDKITEQSRRE